MRRQGCGHEEAEELPRIFCGSAGAPRFGRFSRGEGTVVFVSAGVVEAFLADERRRVMAMKRGKGQHHIPLEELYDNGEAVFERAIRGRLSGFTNVAGL